MTRQKRFHIPTALYHVMLRGNAGHPIFFSDRDRCYFCLLLQRAVELYDCRIHAFCFMSNHIHLAVQVGTISLSRIMQNIALRYTKRINRNQRRLGHIFQSRFKSIIVDDNRYLIELIRYIHMNPVRANLVKKPEDYLWSSHRAYIGSDQIAWLTCETVLDRFGNHIHTACAHYKNFILQPVDHHSELPFEMGISEGMLGDDHFVDSVREKTGLTINKPIALSQVAEIICQKYSITLEDLKAKGKHRGHSHARAILALVVRSIDSISLEELSYFLIRELSALSKLASRLEARSRSSEALSSEIGEIQAALRMSTSQA